MPNFNPFSNDNEDTSFEQATPVTSAANNIAKAASAQTDAQIQAANQAIVDQLYGSSDPPQEQGTDEVNTQHTDYSNSATRQATSHSGHSGTNAKGSNSNSNKTPEEEAEMEKIRHELFGNYGAKFNTSHNGPFTVTTSLDQEMEKARHEREQQEMQRKQDEEEEERQRKEQVEEARDLDFDMPAGKKTGVMFGKKQQQPMALRLAKTKTESNRGASG